MTTRRDFLRAGAAFGGAGLMSSVLPGFSALAQPSGYKALVCVFLAGGMDGHDSVIPLDAASYGEWSSVRERLLRLYADEEDDSRERANLIRLGEQADGRAFGVPRQLRPLAQLYGRGKAAVVANVGPLIVPTTGAQAQGAQVPLPPRLMSHNDQQSTWQSLGPEGSVSGWGGRMSEIMATSRSPYAAVSVAGNPVFVAGRQTPPLLLSAGDVEEVWGTTWDWAYGSREVPAALREHFGAAIPSLNSAIASDRQSLLRSSVATMNELAALTAGTTAGEDVALPDNQLSAQLATVAKLISLRGQLGAPRQVFFVKAGGFDTHEDQHRELPPLQVRVADAVASFFAWTERSGMADRVTTFTASDFGRTLTTNATGTDHGWGNHHFVVGGAVRGGRILGEVPPSVEGHAQDLGRGRMVPTLATSEYAASLGRWFGLSEGDLRTALPGLDRLNPRAVELF